MNDLEFLYVIAEDYSSTGVFALVSAEPQELPYETLRIPAGFVTHNAGKNVVISHQLLDEIRKAQPKFTAPFYIDEALERNL